MNQPLVRAFIAIELPADIQTQLEGVMKQLKTARASGVRWVAASNIHLTLKFLGDTAPAALTNLGDLLKPAVAVYNPMELVVGGLGAFPNRRHPRVIWVGVKTPPEIQTFFKAVEAAAIQIGCPAEERGFSPHLTLGRVQRNISQLEIDSIANALSSVEVGELGHFQATGCTLFRSDLRPTGSKYTSLAHFPFGQ